MVSIRSNISALKAQRQLASATDALSRSYERLSSGLRINRASDDAASLSISEKLRNETRLYSTAIRNVNDGLSLLNIADGALDQQTNIINRLLELAEQAANGTFSDTQRASLDTEYRQLTREFNRISQATTFNGINPLAGGRGSEPDSINVQVGITGSENGMLSVNVVDTGPLSGTLSMSDLDGVSGYTGGDLVQAFTIAGGGAAPGYSTTRLGQLFGDRYLRFEAQSSTGQQREFALGFYAYGTSGGSYTAGYLLFSKSSSGNWVTETNSNTLLVDPSTGLVTSPSSAIIQPTLGVSGGTITVDLRGLRLQNITSPFQTESALDSTGVETRSRALLALQTAQQRLVDLNQYRGNFGSTSSRLSTALSVLQAAAVNSATANSRIRDVDVASEVAQLTAKQILQQTAAQVLSIASKQPALALGLLEG